MLEGDWPVSQPPPWCLSHQEEPQVPGILLGFGAGRMGEASSWISGGLSTGRVPHHPGTGTNCQRLDTGVVSSSVPILVWAFISYHK